MKVTAAQKEKMEKDHDKIKEYYKGILKEWADDLASRPLDVKKSVEGRAATKACQQTADTLKGFFKLCTKRRVPYDIRSNLLKAADQMEKGEFDQAFKTYLLITIGDAPWPLGVTATGIYERSSRERIQQENCGHVMHNDTVRQYLTSIKRLMTYKEEKVKNRHVSEFSVCLHLIRVHFTPLQIAISLLFSSNTCILSFLQLVCNCE